MALVSRCNLIQNLSDMLPLCEEEEDQKECLELINRAFSLIRTPSSHTKVPNAKSNMTSIILPASMLLQILKKSFPSKNDYRNETEIEFENETETDNESKFEMTSSNIPKSKKVRIQEPEVSSINLIPTNEENKRYQTSTHFPSTIESNSNNSDRTRESETEGETEGEFEGGETEGDFKTRSENADVLNIEGTQTDQLSFMDEYGNRFASFFGDM